MWFRARTGYRKRCKPGDRQQERLPHNSAAKRAKRWLFMRRWLNSSSNVTNSVDEMELDAEGSATEHKGTMRFSKKHKIEELLHHLNPDLGFFSDDTKWSPLNGTPRSHCTLVCAILSRTCTMRSCTNSACTCLRLHCIVLDQLASLSKPA